MVVRRVYWWMRHRGLYLTRCKTDIRNGLYCQDVFALLLGPYGPRLHLCFVTKGTVYDGYEQSPFTRFWVTRVPNHPAERHNSLHHLCVGELDFLTPIEATPENYTRYRGLCFYLGDLKTHIVITMWILVGGSRLSRS